MKSLGQKRKTPYNSTYNKLAVLCYVETFLINGNLVLRNYIRADSRQLLVATKRYQQIYEISRVIHFDNITIQCLWSKY